MVFDTVFLAGDFLTYSLPLLCQWYADNLNPVSDFSSFPFKRVFRCMWQKITESNAHLPLAGKHVN